jgi:hypothetical protein
MFRTQPYVHMELGRHGAAVEVRCRREAESAQLLGGCCTSAHGAIRRCDGEACAIRCARRRRGRITDSARGGGAVEAHFAAAHPDTGLL